MTIAPSDTVYFGCIYL